MKKIIILILLFFLVGNCRKESQEICGTLYPQTNLVWLKNIIDLADNDNSGNYVGSIYAEKYKGKDVIYIDMMMGSGGVMGHWYNCDGSILKFSYSDMPIITKSRLIYSNVRLKNE